MMKLDGTITVGDLGVMLSLLISVFAAYNRLSISIAEIKAEVEIIKGWYDRCMNGNCLQQIRERREIGRRESD